LSRACLCKTIISSITMAQKDASFAPWSPPFSLPLPSCWPAAAAEDAMASLPPPPAPPLSELLPVRRGGVQLLQNNAALFPQRFLCLSRACLGSMVSFSSYLENWLKTGGVRTDAEDARNVLRARQDKTRQGKARQGKARQGKTRQDKMVRALVISLELLPSVSFLRLSSLFIFFVLI
jgi:hypothetical protein